MVLDGQADLGAVNALVFQSMLTENKAELSGLHVVAETPPYANYVWAVPESLPEADRDRIRDAFLALSPEDPVQGGILASVGANAYLPASDSSYVHIVRSAQKLDIP
jgi:ABC-type phosphate/phosphonate transport system substrate-binding protein